MINNKSSVTHIKNNPMEWQPKHSRTLITDMGTAH